MRLVTRSCQHHVPTLHPSRPPAQITTSRRSRRQSRVKCHIHRLQRQDLFPLPCDPVRETTRRLHVLVLLGSDAPKPVVHPLIEHLHSSPPTKPNQIASQFLQKKAVILWI